MLKLVLRIVIYVSISCIVFLEIVNALQFSSTVEKKENATSVHGVQKVEKETDDYLSKARILQNENIKSTLAERFHLKSNNRTSEQKSMIEMLKERYIFFEYVSMGKNKSVVIPVFYLLMLMALVFQTGLLALSTSYKELRRKFSAKKLDAIFLYASEWNINAPTVLGVMGTIFSFGIVLSNISDVSSLSTVFKENFANAALTTILGGAVYCFNLFLNVVIAKNLSEV